MWSEFEKNERLGRDSQTKFANPRIFFPPLARVLFAFLGYMKWNNSEFLVGNLNAKCKLQNSKCIRGHLRSHFGELVWTLKAHSMRSCFYLICQYT